MATTATYPIKVVYLINQILLGNLTYLEVVTAKPELQAQIDAYIADKGLIIDKTK